MLFRSLWLTALAAVMALHGAIAIQLDAQSPDSIKTAAKAIGSRMVEKYYYGGSPPSYYSNIPGLLPEAPQKYYWWETGSMLLVLLDYWVLTGDDHFNDLITEGMLFQKGANYDFMVQNQSKSLGNDDQVFWAYLALAAAEGNYPNPPSDQPGWLAMAQAVMNEQVSRWDGTTCGGGLRWQIFAFNNGYDYKNSASNTGLFNLAARLSAYTGNRTYSDWAEKLYEWQLSINLISEKGEVFDGSDDLLNCTEINHIRWSYTAGMAIYGSAVMYSITNDTKWKTRVDALWTSSAENFFTKDKIMTESACEREVTNCNVDQQSFKATFSRFLSSASLYAPWLSDEIAPYISASAAAAAAQCTGGPEGDNCGTVWSGTYDGNTGVGQMMSGMSVIQNLLINRSKKPFTNSTGGTSQGNSAAGSPASAPTGDYGPITTADKAGAGILTAMALVGTISLAWFVIV